MLNYNFGRNLLIDYWMGHENREMGTRYARQLIENIEWRKEWGEKVGLGLKLPSLPLGIGQLSEQKMQPAKAAQSTVNVGDIWLPEPYDLRTLRFEFGIAFRKQRARK